MNSKYRKYGKALILMVLFMVVVSGCYYRKQAKDDQIIVKMNSGEMTSIEVGGGAHTDMTSAYAGAEVFDIGTQEETWVSRVGGVWSDDKQPLTVTVTVKFRLTRDTDKLEALWLVEKKLLTSAQYRTEQVFARLETQVREVVPQFTMQQIVGIEAITDRPAGMGEREYVTSLIAEQMQPELEAIGIDLITLMLSDIDGTDDEYENLLNEGVKIELLENIARDQVGVAEAEQEEQQVRNTTNELNATSDAEVRRINALVYDNPIALQIRIAEIWAQAVNAGDVIIVVEEGDDVAWLLNQQIAGSSMNDAP